MEFNALGARLSSSSPDLGGAVEVVEAQYEGEDLVAAFNPTYLSDGLNAAIGEQRPRRGPRRAEAGVIVEGRPRRSSTSSCPSGCPRPWASLAGRGAAVQLAWIEVRDFRNHRERPSRCPPGLDGGRRARTARGRPTCWRRCTTCARSSPRGSARDLPLVGGRGVRVPPWGGRQPRRAVPRRGRGPRLRAESGPGEPIVVRRNGTSPGFVRAVFSGPDDLAIVQGDPDRATPVHGRGAALPVAGTRAGTHRLRAGPAAAEPTAQGLGGWGRGARRTGGVGRRAGERRRRRHGRTRGGGPADRARCCGRVRCPCRRAGRCSPGRVPALDPRR